MKPCLGLGRANLSLYRPESADLYFAKCTEIDGENIEALSGRGIALDMAGDHKKARELYTRALMVAPDDMGILNNLALSYLMAGEYDAAIKALAPLAFTPTSTAVIRQNLAMAYGLAGDEAAAARIARLDLDHPTAENNLKFYRQIRRMEDTSLLRRLLLGPRIPEETVS